ncbi:MAG: type II toxin-antitoxin system ParD family antitoxin [Rhodoferax sp.]|nr:type II toxin-antitoxin system ParD family antitoxin [Rhodoferax sp.]
MTPQLEDLVGSKMASGLYTLASEVVHEALRLMDEQDRLRARGPKAIGKLSPNTNSPVDCLCLAKSWATGPARPAAA